jgi:hypothetical protein
MPANESWIVVSMKTTAAAKLTALVLLGSLMLASCGGGSDGGTAPVDRQAGQGIALGEPNGSALVTAAFIADAQQVGCADVRNRLYVIDQKYVFADRAGNCADLAYTRTLYGATLQASLCTESDSIAGPNLRCTDASVKPLFDTILANRSAADLGLGPTHSVSKVLFTSKDPVSAIASLPLTQIEHNRHSHVQVDQNLVVRDQAAWATLWASHAGAGVAVPAVDFGKSMVLAVFMGTMPHGCYDTSITDAYLDSGVLKVIRVDNVPLRNSTVLCTQSVIYPSHIVTVARTDAPVQFVVQLEPTK